MSKTNKGGRPLKRIDWDMVEAMLSAGATGSDIADILGMSRDHFYRRVKIEKDIPLSDWQTRCRAITRQRLRAAQLRAAMGYADEKIEIEYKIQPDGTRIPIRETITKFHRPPDVAMLIFLGKNMLNQSDSPEPGDNSSQFGKIPNFRLVGDEDTPEQDDQQQLTSVDKDES